MACLESQQPARHHVCGVGHCNTQRMHSLFYSGQRSRSRAFGRRMGFSSQSHSRISVSNHKGRSTSLAAELNSEGASARKRSSERLPGLGQLQSLNTSASSDSNISGFGDSPRRLPTQGESVVRGIEPMGLQLQERERPPPDVDFLSVRLSSRELIAMQQNGPKDLGFFGTRNMGFLHQNLIEVLSYAMVLTGNHIFTSGATGTNAAVIRGALRAENPELLTVVLPQSLRKQPPESQELLSQIKPENLIEMRQNDGLTLIEASRICNRDIVSRVQQVICFAFHDSNLLLETCDEAKENRKIVTLFYLD